MSLRANATYQVPEATAAVARAIFPDGNPAMRMYDELGMLVRDAEFADLFPPHGRPAMAPVCLALVTLLQFWKGFTLKGTRSAGRSRRARTQRLDVFALPCVDRSWLQPHRLK